MKTIREQVIEFHKAFIPEQGTGEGPPHVPADDVVRNRLKLIFEEAFELLDACTAPDSIHDENMRDIASKAVQKVLAAPIKVNLVEVADALADLDYVIEGSRLAFGIDGPPIATEIHSSNMTKVGGHRNEQGKWVKPATYRPADIAGELKKQGWKP